MRTPELEAAYRATAYCVDLPSGGVSLRLGEASPRLVVALAAHKAGEWAILCAANPGSEQRSAADNAQRFSQLYDLLADAGYECWLGVNLADGGDWPPEASVCVPGLPRGEALKLALRFGQNAIVAGDARGVPELVWAD
ncbi:MAG: DUF3293 domain-containing protein [Rhodocyclales bacterium]|nr:DUF3293 domain-containing protein [Rhodocyclales bacterium]